MAGRSGDYGHHALPFWGFVPDTMVTPMLEQRIRGLPAYYRIGILNMWDPAKRHLSGSAHVALNCTWLAL